MHTGPILIAIDIAFKFFSVMRPARIRITGMRVPINLLPRLPTKSIAYRKNHTERFEIDGFEIDKSDSKLSKTEKLNQAFVYNINALKNMKELISQIDSKLLAIKEA